MSSGGNSNAAREAKARFESALEHIAAGRFAQAVPLLARCVALVPRWAAAHVNLANCILDSAPPDPATGDVGADALARAETHYKTALRAQPDSFEAAANLGAGWWRRTHKIVFPLIAANLLAGGLLAFSFAMLEVSDSLILAQREASR